RALVGERQDQQRVLLVEASRLPVGDGEDAEQLAVGDERDGGGGGPALAAERLLARSVPVGTVGPLQRAAGGGVGQPRRAGRGDAPPAAPALVDDPRLGDDAQVAVLVDQPDQPTRGAERRQAVLTP